MAAIVVVVLIMYLLYEHYHHYSYYYSHPLDLKEGGNMPIHVQFQLQFYQPGQ
jgi:hypothetical protein